MVYKVRFPKPPQYYDVSYQNVEALVSQASIGGPNAKILNLEAGSNEMIIHFVPEYTPNAAQRTAIKEAVKNLATIIEDNIDTPF